MREAQILLRARRIAEERARLTAALERALVLDVQRWLAKVGALAASQLRAGHTHRAEFAAHTLAPRLLRTLTARLRDAAEAAARMVIRDLEKAAPGALERKGFIADVIAAATRWVQHYAAARVVQITESTRKILRRTIEQAIDEPEGYRDTAKRIREVTEGEIGRNRAMRIARTEVHGATERGNIEAVRATGFAYEKRWAAVHDKRTRHAHLEADGQQVPLNEKFRVGGYLMDFPGDQSAPPSMTIACRCVTQNIPVIPGLSLPSR